MNAPKGKISFSLHFISNEEIEQFSGDLLLWAARIDGMEILDYVLPLVQVNNFQKGSFNYTSIRFFPRKFHRACNVKVS